MAQPFNKYGFSSLPQSLVGFLQHLLRKTFLEQKNNWNSKSLAPQFEEQGFFVSVYTQWKSKSKLAAGCSKHCFEVVDKTDEVSSKHCFEVVDRTDEVSYLYLRQGDVDAVWRDFRRVLTVVNFLWIEVVLEEALFCQTFILSSRLTVVVVGVDWNAPTRSEFSPDF